jgi:Zn-dependent peptidase ImmA (M78 family)
MHREGRERLFCRASAVDPDPAEEARRPERPVYEREADAFAAALLMPARLMEREYARDRDFYTLCDRFQVSAKAMSRRLRAVIQG